MLRFASGAFIALGVVLVIAAALGGLDIGPFVVGAASIVVGVVLRVSSPRRSPDRAG